MSAGHSLLSPSSAPRIAACPASLARSLLFPEETTSAASEEGVLAHATLEAVYKREEIPDEATDEMIKHARLLWNMFPAAESEVRVDPAKHPALAGFPAGIFEGTADVLESDGLTVTVIDYKYGRVSVAPTSLQIALYAGGCWEKHVENYIVGVYQPRTEGHPLELNAYTASELSDVLAAYAERARLALKLVHAQQLGAAPPMDAYGPGDACKWCPAKAGCPGLMQGLLDSQPVEAAHTVPEMLDLAEVAPAWAEQTKKAALDYATMGGSIEGWTLGLGRSGNRFWNDEEKLSETAATEGLDIYGEPQLLSPAALEKRYPKLPENIRAYVSVGPRPMKLARVKAPVNDLI